MWGGHSFYSFNQLQGSIDYRGFNMWGGDSSLQFNQLQGSIDYRGIQYVGRAQFSTGLRVL